MFAPTAWDIHMARNSVKLFSIDLIEVQLAISMQQVRRACHIAFVNWWNSKSKTTQRSRRRRNRKEMQFQVVIWSEFAVTFRRFMANELEWIHFFLRCFSSPLDDSAAIRPDNYNHNDDDNK